MAEPPTRAFPEGSIVHTSVPLIGGIHLTTDIALGIRHRQDEAEKIGRKYGCALVEMVEPSEMIDVPSVGGESQGRFGDRFCKEIIEGGWRSFFQLCETRFEKTPKKRCLS